MNNKTLKKIVRESLENYRTDKSSPAEQWRELRVAQGLERPLPDDDIIDMANDFEEPLDYYSDADSCQDYNHFVNDYDACHWGLRAFNPDDFMARRASIFVDEPKSYQCEPLPDEYLNEIIKTTINKILK